MNQKSKTIFIAIIALLVGMLVMYLANNYTIQKKDTFENSSYSNNQQSPSSNQKSDRDNKEWNNDTSGINNSSQSSSNKIDELTEENLVVDYVKKNHELPDYYITKSKARNEGWVASKGNLCDVLPGRAIGGDQFSNREGTLPKGVQYFEADVNYECGRRNADRIVFTKNGDVYLTKNHYKSFQKQ